MTMMTKEVSTPLRCLSGALLVASMSALAQEAPAPPGSPSATTTIDGRYLPAPPQPFRGQIYPNALESTPYWPARIVPPPGAPNVLLILLDDVGYGASSTFGGVIPTPALERLARMGLRYTNMNSTALCSPSRAAIITGRNHHTAGFGVVSEQATGFPGYDSFITKDVATVGEILKQNGYSTSWFGKNHNTPGFQSSMAGPFDQWPMGLGFEYFYGFMGGDTNQWQPNLYRQTTPIYPYVGNPKFNLITAMADDAITWIKSLNEIAPDKKFFCYYAPGATHAPHHATPEWIQKIHEMHLFDDGWNKLRDTIYANQKKLGVIPPDAQLTPWPKDRLKEWDQLSPEEKKLFIREVEVYAAYLAYVDDEIGRVVKVVEDMGKLDDTLIFYVVGDNGSSAEGTLNGTPNEIASLNGFNATVEQSMKYYDAWGSDRTYNHMAVPWSWAFDTPFSWTKQIASHFGGVRQGTVIAWGNHIGDPGGIRNQFHHFIDVVPTILEAANIPAPTMVNGVTQKPLEGVSMAYTFDKANANAPSQHHTQYFEMFADRAIYHDGWIASTKVIRAPWDVASATNPDPARNATWELYDLSKDWSQNNDLAAGNPAKLQKMQDLFWVEATRHNVLPLDSSVAPRVVIPKPSLAAGRSVFNYSGTIVGVPSADAPSLLNASYSLIADVEVPSGGGDGMINTNGGRFGGYGFYILKGKPVFLWNVLGMKEYRWQAPQPLAAGKHMLEFGFKYDGLGMGTLAYNSVSGIGRSGTGTLKVDGKVISTQKMEFTVPIILQFDESFDVGADSGTPVSDNDYQVPFAFNGRLNKLTIAIDRPKLSEADIKRLQEEGQRNNHTSE